MMEERFARTSFDKLYQAKLDQCGMNRYYPLTCNILEALILLVIVTDTVTYWYPTL